MYPQLMPPLLIGLGVALGFVTFLVVRRPVLRRLALRQIRRRPTEALLVVLGSALGTTLIVASLVVGDSLGRSVRQTAYDVLGPIDEVVRSSSSDVGDAASHRLQALQGDPDVDGILTVHGDLGSATTGKGAEQRAAPRTLVWDLDFSDASRFGAPDPSGLSVDDPGLRRVVLNDNLAQELGAKTGSRVTFYLYGQPAVFTVAQVVPAEGLAGMGLGAARNRDAFFSAGTLEQAARESGQQPSTATLVSNRGGVESGEALTDAVTPKIRTALGDLDTTGAALSTPKQEVLDRAEETSAVLGALFLFIASFSIIAGILLLVNIFVMLSEERKGQLGMLRAIGMRRRRVTGEFAIEGALYGAVAAILGAALGVAVGRLVVVIAVNILNSFDRGDNPLAIVFDVRPVSLVNGMAAGFLFAFVAVVLTSVRIARTNIIAAIRDLEAPARTGSGRRLTVASAALTALFVAASVPAVASNAGALTYLLPALAALSAIPLLRRVVSAKVATTGVALGVLVWGLGAHLVRPHMYDDASTATYVVMGTMLSFAAVVLLSQYQWLVLSPLRPLVNRPSEAGLATRLAIAYPTARRFRTAATLAMYCIVVLVMVLLAQISAIIRAGLDTAISDASAGWTLRADFNPSTPLYDLPRAVTGGQFSGKFGDAAPLLTVTGEGSDPLHRATGPLPILAIGVPGQMVGRQPALNDRIAGASDDAAVWRLLGRDPRFVLVDAFYGADGGPQGKPIEAGQTIILTDPRTGTNTQKTVAGVMKDGTAFYGVSAGEFRFPVIMSPSAVRETFGLHAHVSSLLLRTAPGVDRAQLAAEMQAAFLPYGFVVTDIPQAVRDTYAANTQMFRLMQGYLALGLLVAITGLGVIMVRSVRERRRTIGVLRALGFRSRTVRRAFLAESTFIALEGVVVGTLLGVLTTWLLYQNSPAFAGLDSPFPIAWQEISVTVSAAVLASLLATVLPARRAAKIRPALAVRVAD